ncbi:MAG: DUF3943 domain-containing protein [bacterium]
MNGKMQHKFLLVLLILTFVVAGPAAAKPNPPGSFVKKAETFGILAKRGQHLSFFRTSLLPYAFQWSFVLTVNRGLGGDIRKSNFKRWLRNVKTLPQIPDGDHWVTNYVGHPLLGASVFAFYKHRGFSNRQSMIGTFLQSTLFEYTVEGWKKPPSGVDLIVTPLLGSLIGSKIGMNSLLLSSSYAISKYIFRLF